jgi:hypothetical protein
MPDVLDEAQAAIGQVTDKGVQLADTLRPTTIDILSGNPHTLAEWLIYIVCAPITLPLTFIVAAIRWIMIEAPMVERQILKLVGIGRTTALGEVCLKCGLGDIPFFGPLIEAIINPSNEFDLGIMEGAANQALGSGLAIVEDPLLRPVGYCMNRAYPNKLLSAEQSVLANHKGFMNSDAMAYQTAAEGYPGDQATTLWNLTKIAPDAGSAMILLNRGVISEENAIQWMRISGLDQEEAEQLVNLRLHVPSVGEIQGYLVGNGYELDEIEQWGLNDEYPDAADGDLEKNGADQDIGLKTWRAHWMMPGNDILLDMYHRGIIDYASLMSALKFNNVPLSMREKVIEQGVTLPMRRMINGMMRYGVVDEDYVKSIYLQFGYSEDNATRLTLLAMKQINPLEQGDLATDATQAFIDDTIDEPTLVNFLLQAGHNQLIANLHAANAEHKKEVNLLKTIESYVHEAYINGDMSLDDAVNYCLEYGETQARLQQLRLLWQEEMVHTIKHVSEADARTAYTKGLINAVSLRSYLAALHYADADIDLIVAVENATLVAPQEDIVAPITSATGKAHSFTKAELKKMLVNGIINSGQWWLEMASLGYTDAQIQAYAELIAVATTTATTAS